MTTYGYARVSTNGQDLGSQEAELMAAGCAKVFKEKVSGAKTDRAELAKVIRRIEPGDVLVVTRLDRLARSTRDLLNVLATIREREAGFRSLKDTWADTTTPHGRLMLTALGGLAEFERELIRARTGDGRARAKARGVKFGRPTALTPHQRHEALQRLGKAKHRRTWQGRSMSVRPRSHGLQQPDSHLTAIFVARAAKAPATAAKRRAKGIEQREIRAIAGSRSVVLLDHVSSSNAYPLKLFDELIIGRNCLLDRDVIGLTKANGLQQLSPNVFH